VRAFYGLVGYYRRFIEGFATIAEPLTRLTRKGTKFLWTDEAGEACARLKTAMLVVPTLAFPCPDRPGILDTDSSDVAYGSVLSQLVDGQKRPIACDVTHAKKLLLNPPRVVGSDCIPATFPTLFVECTSHPTD